MALPSPASFTASPPSGWRAPAPLAFALLFSTGWALLGALLNPGQPGDHFEQFTWSHGFVWGYHKHPPLPTWMLGAAIQVFGFWSLWPYVLAALCNAGTAVFTWQVARRLMGERVADVAIVLWGLHFAYSWKGQLFNHNTVMMLFMAAAAWVALRAGEPDPAARRGWRYWGWWVALGVLAGLAMLSKYQSAVGLAGIILALAGSGMLAGMRPRLGLALAVAICLGVFAPHVAWVFHHQFTTLHYASSTAMQLDTGGRVHKLLSFSAVHLRMMLTVLLAMLAVRVWQRLSPLPVVAGDADDTGAPPRVRRAWMFGLLGFPLVVLLVMCLAAGVRLQDHWGFQAIQFIGLWFAWLLRRHLAPGTPARLMGVAAAIHLAMMAAYAQPAYDPASLAGRGRPDQFYPARQLADTVRDAWQQASPCPLRFVVGPTYEAGMVSVYAGGNPAVLELGDVQKSPWVDLEAMRQAGSVQLFHSADEAPPGTPPLHTLGFHPGGAQGSSYDILWTIVPPQSPACHDR